MKFERMDVKQKKVREMIKLQSDKIDEVIYDIHQVRKASFPNVVTGEEARTHAEVLILLANRLDKERAKYTAMYDLYCYLFRETP